MFMIVSRCDVCQEYRYAQQQQPLQMHERRDRPWATVDYYYSHYPEIALLSNESSRQVIIHLKSLFSRYGIPSKCISDGGLQFASEEFRQFTSEWGIEHRMSSPYYPQSNGLAENGVKIVKRLLRNAADRGEDAYLALLAHRSSPLDCGKSPAELLFGRKIRTHLPYRCETYTRKSAPHDRGKLLLHPNDTVRVKDPRRRRWSERARVVGLSGPRSYDVQCEDGRRMRRNRQHLLATRETFKPSRTEFVALPDNATQQSTVSTPATAIETHPDAETEEIDKVTELSEHTSSVSSSPVRRRSERVRKASVRVDLQL